MNTLLKTLLASAAIMLSTQSFAAGEGLCLAFTTVARSSAEARVMGVDGEKLIASMPPPKHDGTAKDKKLSQKVETARNMIIRYVYAMQLSEDDAAKTVYLKCKAGEYDGI